MSAEDANDLQIIAACLQDALVPLMGMEYDQSTGKFHLVANRFCWECAPEILEGDSFYMRVPTALSFHHVTEIKKKALDLHNKHELINLMTIHDHDNCIHLVFSGGTEIRLTVDRISCLLRDVDEPYHTINKPCHATA
jgi:hypothetical protein